MRSKIIFTVIVSVLYIITSHPTFIPGRENVQCLPPKTKDRGFFQPFVTENEFSYPTPVSYHFHITFKLTNKNEIAKAVALREKAREHFKDHLGPDCYNFFDNKNLCMIIDHPIDVAVDGSPFPIGDWSIWVPNSYLNLLLAWFSQNRGDLSLLVHPNTGCLYEDHGAWAFWAGDKWNLDLSIFTPNVQEAEIGHYPGDIDNPICLAKGFNCGSPDYKGAFLACCEGFTCNCADKCICQ